MNALDNVSGVSNERVFHIFTNLINDKALHTSAAFYQKDQLIRHSKDNLVLIKRNKNPNEWCSPYDA